MRATANLLIGMVAARAGVNVQTVRYYERRGLVRPAARRESGYREYTEEAVDIIHFIQRAKELGFTLEEIGELLSLRNNTRARCGQVRAKAAAKLSDIERRLNHLQAMKGAMTILLYSCKSDGSIRHCPIIESLSDRKISGKEL